MYAEPETSFGDITRYFEERDIKVYGKSLTRSYLSQLLRNPVYAQADLEKYEFFKSQGTVVVNDAADFAVTNGCGTNGCYLYQGRDVKEDKDKSLKDQILVIAPHEGFVSADVWLRCRKKLMTNTTFQNGRKARNTWLAGKIKCGKCGYALKTTHNPSGYEYLRCSNVPSGPTTRAVRGAVLSARRSLSSSFLPLWEKSSGSSSYCGAARKRQTRRLPPIRWSLHR